MARPVVSLAAVLLLTVALLLGADPPRELVSNPYATVDFGTAQALRTNLHTHTTQSDGRQSPAEVVAEYQAQGYHALAISDHNTVTWPWEAHGIDAAATGLIPIPGNELSRHHHSLSLFTPYETPSNSWGEALDGLAAAGGIGIICHPAMHWPTDLADDNARSFTMSEAFRNVTQGNFTVACWFRTKDTRRNLLMGNYRAKAPGALNLELHTDNRVRLFVESPSAGTVDLNVPADALSINTRDGQWHHLAGLRRDGRVQLWLDGRLAGEKAGPARAFTLRGERYFLGRDYRLGNTELRGDLDDAAVWNRALEPTEIAALVAGQAVATGLLAAYPFETSAGQPVAPGPATGPLDDAQGQASALAEATGQLRYVTDVPAPLAATGRSRHALRIGARPLPTSVPDAARDLYAELFRKYANLAGLEIWNGSRPVTEIPLDRELWDRLLTEFMPDRPIWGFANDDTHSKPMIGRDWTVMFCTTADAGAVRAALTAGSFTFSTTRQPAGGTASPEGTPRLLNVVHDPAAGTLTLQATVADQPLPDANYTWISAGREVARGPVLAYRHQPGLQNYVRAELTGPGGMTATQPFGLR